MQEQRESQKSATGHDFGSSSFKLVGVHILEMYNPMKRFYAQAGGAKGEKETAKKEKKQPDLLQQIEK